MSPSAADGARTFWHSAVLINCPVLIQRSIAAITEEVGEQGYFNIESVGANVTAASLQCALHAILDRVRMSILVGRCMLERPDRGGGAVRVERCGDESEGR